MPNFTRRQWLSTVPAWPLLAAPLSVGSLEAAPTKGGLRAGAATADMTLPLGMNNGGVIMRGEPARSIHDELHARALVLDDGTTPLALVICDLRMIGRELVDRARQMAATALGWPPQNLLIAATHTHAAPGLVGLRHDEADRWYEDFVVVRIADAIRRAAAQLAPAKIGWASVAKPEHVFNRRWKLRSGTTHANPFGETSDRVVTNPSAGLDVVEPAGTVDPELSVLSVQHADGRPLAVLANYGLHYIGGYTPASVSADYFAIFSAKLGALLGAGGDQPSFVGMMSNGASGDVNGVNRSAPRERQPPWQKMQAVAEDLAEAAAQVCRQIHHDDKLSLAVATQDLQLAVRRPDEARLSWARATVGEIRNRNKLTRPEVYAEEALALAAGPDQVAVPLQAIRIGTLGIAASSCEVFAETGLEIKRRSALRPTFLIELANGYNGYLPTPEQHALGGYETWPARSAYLEVDASSKIRDGLLELLARVAP